MDEEHHGRHILTHAYRKGVAVTFGTAAHEHKRPCDPVDQLQHCRCFWSVRKRHISLRLGLLPGLENNAKHEGVVILSDQHFRA